MTSSFIFVAVFCLDFISFFNSSIRSFEDRNFISALCFSSELVADSISCRICSFWSFSWDSLSSAETINLWILSSWEVFWFKMPEISDASSRSDSIFLSTELKPEDERLSNERVSFNCFSVFFLILVAWFFFWRSWITKFSNVTNNSFKESYSVKLLI